jgi:hypothetical protein
MNADIFVGPAPAFVHSAAMARQQLRTGKQRYAQ